MASVNEHSLVFATDHEAKKPSVRLIAMIVPGLGRRLFSGGEPAFKGVTTVISKESYLFLGGFREPLRKYAVCPTIDYIDLEIKLKSTNIKAAFRARIVAGDTLPAERALTAILSVPVGRYRRHQQWRPGRKQLCGTNASDTQVSTICSSPDSDKCEASFTGTRSAYPIGTTPTATSTAAAWGGNDGEHAGDLGVSPRNEAAGKIFLLHDGKSTTIF